jgi:hypothetical protein
MGAHYPKGMEPLPQELCHSLQTELDLVSIGELLVCAHPQRPILNADHSVLPLAQSTVAFAVPCTLPAELMIKHWLLFCPLLTGQGESPVSLVLVIASNVCNHFASLSLCAGDCDFFFKQK